MCGIPGTLGSSPHAWGTLLIARSGSWFYRFIPTRMGNTPGLNSDRRVFPVHPHTHGEHPNASCKTSPGAGSSPHAWGTRTFAPARPFVTRFIPTRMGNTKAVIFIYLLLAVHPHTHGEHMLFLSACIFNTGSSPHAWGTLADSRLLVALCRFIPTRMGNTKCREFQKV